jgi:hypothetical protein
MHKQANIWTWLLVWSHEWEGVLMDKAHKGCSLNTYEI